MAEIKKVDTSVTMNVPAAAAVSKGLLYGINSSGQAVAAHRTTGPVVARGFAITSLTAAQVTNGDYVALSPKGIVECAAADIAGGTFTVGATVYTDTAGKYTTTKPSSAADILQAVGVALSTTKVFVDISMLPLTLQSAGTTTINA